MRALIADDDPIQRACLGLLMRAWGFDVQEAADGEGAWNALTADAPDVGVLDWEMPGLDGVEVCRRTRRLGRERYTYLLLITARAARDDVIGGLEAGADDYLIKPYDPDELRARLNTGRRIIHLQNELIAAREAMRRQATRDGLTGAWNRATIIEILQREVTRSRRDNLPLAVVLADVDHFKRTNDTFGHPAGDAVLCEVVTRLEAAVRPVDVIGRYGGEEFLLVLPGCDEASARKVCERLRERVAADPCVHDGRAIPVTASFGVAVGGPRTEGVTLVSRADEALYRAKAGGRNRVEVATG